MDSVALIMIDMQEPFLKALPDGERLVRRVRFALGAAALLGIRTAFTTQLADKLGPVLPDLIQAADAGAGETPVFDKSAFSALEAPGLGDWLETNAIEHLVLAGLETSICVCQTALAAIDADFAVTVLTDCVGGRRAEDGQQVLRHLAAAGCHPLPSETVFYSILRGADHPAFRDFTQLVKTHSDPA